MFKRIHRALFAGYSYSHAFRVVELAAIAGFMGLQGVLGWHLACQVLGLGVGQALAWLALAPLLGYLMADLFSGIVHFLFDSFWSETTPLIGPTFVRSFREHHTDPQSICRHDFVEVNGSNCIATVLVQVPVLFALTSGAVSLSALFGLGSLYFMFFGVFLTNQFHKWAHADAVPGWVSWLQRHRLILSREHHSLHHTAPFSSYFCITTGWLNPLLERIGFFRALFWLVRQKNIRHEAERAYARQQVAKARPQP
jgi:ubiquitin-conjugating enzyme E2 variant